MYDMLNVLLNQNVLCVCVTEASMLFHCWSRLALVTE